MVKLIAIIGNVGVGKTTFARQLCKATSYKLALEQHGTRSFHSAFAAGDGPKALANQVDFLLMRAEQEQAIRMGHTVGVMDGGLEQDFYIFTRYFAHAGLLTQAEYALCQRLYQFARLSLPVPDLFIYLHAPIDILAGRYRQRRRIVEVVKPNDIGALEQFVVDWRALFASTPMIHVDATIDDPDFANTVAELRESIQHVIDS